MNNKLQFWNASMLFVLVLLLTACEQERLLPDQEINSNTPLLPSKHNMINKGLATSFKLNGYPGFPILFGRTSVLCVQAPCPCMPMFGYCDEDTWSIWDPIYGIPDQYGGAFLSVEDQQLRLVLANEISQDFFPINNTHQLSTELSEVLGYEQIILLPGEYPIDYSSSAAGEVYLNFSE